MTQNRYFWLFTKWNNPYFLIIFPWIIIIQRYNTVSLFYDYYRKKLQRAAKSRFVCVIVVWHAHLEDGTAYGVLIGHPQAIQLERLVEPAGNYNKYAHRTRLWMIILFLWFLVNDYFRLNPSIISFCTIVKKITSSRLADGLLKAIAAFNRSLHPSLLNLIYS